MLYCLVWVFPSSCFSLSSYRSCLLPPFLIIPQEHYLYKHAPVVCHIPTFCTGSLALFFQGDNNPEVPCCHSHHGPGVRTNTPREHAGPSVSSCLFPGRTVYSGPLYKFQDLIFIIPMLVWPLSWWLTGFRWLTEPPSPRRPLGTQAVPPENGAGSAALRRRRVTVEASRRRCPLRN